MIFILSVSFLFFVDSPQLASDLYIFFHFSQSTPPSFHFSLQSQQETREERRKAREQKRYGKQVQAEKLKERTLQKKESIKSIEKWRKTRKHNDFADDGKAPEGFEDEKRGGGGKGGKARDRGGGGGQNGGGSGRNSTMETQAKREFKNDKFGFGGRKRVRLLFSSPSLPPPSPTLPVCAIFLRACVFFFFFFFFLSPSPGGKSKHWRVGGGC